MSGFAGDDHLSGGGGNDTLVGGEGTDWAVLGVPLAGISAYSIGADQLTADTASGHVVMSGIERVQLDDLLVAFDTHENGHVWQAEALTLAAFGVAPSQALLSQWAAQADALGSMQAVAQAMLDTYAPGGVGDAVLVNYLYGTILGRAPTDGELQQATSEIGPGKTFENQAAFVVSEATSDANVDKMVSFSGSVQFLDGSFFG
jgi:hypothetical protein